MIYDAVEVELVAKKNCPTEETCAEAVGGKVKMKILFPKMKKKRVIKADVDTTK